MPRVSREPLGLCLLDSRLFSDFEEQDPGEQQPPSTAPEGLLP